MQQQAAHTTEFRKETAAATKSAKKAEDIMKLNTAVQLEQLQMSAVNSAALTAALANQTSVEVTQAELLGNILQEIQRDRLGKAEAIMRMTENKRDEIDEKSQALRNYSRNLADGIAKTTSVENIRSIDMTVR